MALNLLDWLTGQRVGTDLKLRIRSLQRIIREHVLALPAVDKQSFVTAAGAVVGDGIKGDIEVSNGGLTLTVPDESVTLAKLGSDVIDAIAGAGSGLSHAQVLARSLGA